VYKPQHKLGASSAENPDDEWDTIMKQVQSAISCTYNKSTGMIPIEVLAGYKTTGMTTMTESKA
jgi:hypothetical protein